MVQGDKLRLPFTPSEPGDIFPKCIGSKVTAYDAFPNHSRILLRPVSAPKPPTLEKKFTLMGFAVFLAGLILSPGHIFFR